MLRNYLTVAIRNLLRDKMTTVINIAGLSVAVATTILLGIVIYMLWQGDGEFFGSDRLFRVLSREVNPKGEVTHRAWQRVDLAQSLADAFPEVENTSRVIRTQILMAAGERHVSQETIEVDEPFLKMFDVPLIAGDAPTALSRVDQVIVTRWLADRLFGDTFEDYGDLIGRTITLFGKKTQDDYAISGILGDLPKARSLIYHAIIRYENREKYGGSNWWDTSVSTYITLKHTGSQTSLEKKLPEFSRQFVKPTLSKFKTRWKDDPDAFLLKLQPLHEIYAGTHVTHSYENALSPESVWIVAGMALMILAIACLNFTTLSIARSTRRTMEVGVRKVMGASRMHIVRQFWGEGLAMALLALLGGVVLAELALPRVNTTMGFEEVGFGIRLTDLSIPVFVIGAAGLVLLIGIVAGSYPALVAARLQPSETIGRQAGPIKRRRVTGCLLVAQYTMAVLFLVCAVVITNQLNYALGRDLGYAADQVVIVQLRGQNPIKLGERYKAAVRGLPGVVDVAMADREFSQSTSHTTIRTPDGERLSTYIFTVDPGFFNTLDIPLTYGRSFEPDRRSDRTEAVVVNQRLADLHGWGVDAVGQTLDGFSKYGVSKTPTVIGVVPDFHFRSFHEAIQPAIFHFGIRGKFYRVLVRIPPGQMQETLADLREAWKSVAQGRPFEYTFFDEAFAMQYQVDLLLGRTVFGASVIAMVIACMGLFGQAAIAARQRTKEIGVRKVLGATVAQIVSLLSRDLTKLVVVANILALPAGYYLMDAWLSRYVYRVDLSAWLFVVSGLIALSVALLTVGHLGIRAAMGDPVKALRYE